MEKFKISIFEEEHNDIFPSYSTLSEDECKKIRLEIIKKYCIEQENMVNELFSKQDYYADENASEDFNLISTLNKTWDYPSRKCLYRLA